MHGDVLSTERQTLDFQKGVYKSWNLGVGWRFMKI